VAEDPLLSIAEELYSLLPGEFTGTRNQWAKQTRADGDAELAKRVAELHRPSVAAWVVNMLMRHQGPQMEQVLELGASLRQAQADLDADALRELTRQRRQLTTAVTHEGRRLARDLGQKVTDSVADQVQDTLHAAMVDESAAAAVRSGMLVSALAATGVERADVADAVAVPSAIGVTPRARSRPRARRAELRVVADERAPRDGDGPEEDERRSREREEREAQRRRAQLAVDEARAAADEARRRLRKARKRVSRIQARTLQLADELEQTRRRAAELEHELEGLDGAAADGESRRERAERRYAKVQDALATAQAALDELDDGPPSR
jgi:hypothetical protein